MTDNMILRDEAIKAIQRQTGCGSEPWMLGNNSAIAACIAIIRALPAYEVGIKPLEWDAYGWARDEIIGDIVHYSDPEKQREYDCRRAAHIRSALTTTPAQDVGGAGGGVQRPPQDC